MYDIVIIDGNNLANKAFYVNKFMSCTVDGVAYDTGVLYGLVSMLLSAVKRGLFDSDSKLFCVWDSPEGSAYRTGLSATYKAQRKPTTLIECENKKIFYDQLAFAKRELFALRMYQAEKQGYEADDIIYTIVDKVLDKDVYGKVLIISEDKDFRCLISDDVHLYSVSNSCIWDTEYFVEKTGLSSPAYFTDYLALVGDASDNYSGVNGIGDVTAKAILNDIIFTDVEEHPVEIMLKYPDVIERLSITERCKNILRDNSEVLLLNYQLAKFRNVSDVRLRCNHKADFNKAVNMLDKYKMKSLLSAVNEDALRSLV